MKASKLVEIIQSKIKEYGDLEIKLMVFEPEEELREAGVDPISIGEICDSEDGPPTELMICDREATSSFTDGYDEEE